MSSPASDPTSPRAGWLPAIGSWKYYALLGAVAIFVLGPLGGVTAAYMNFSLGFFVGGQVLAGILGSAVTYGYGAEGKHGANYMQTMAASVAGMSGMAVLIQAMVWMGLPQPPAWQLVLYFMSIGMFGVGVGMLYTPFLVDRMRLTFPSGFAVANILRALTDAKLLRASIGKLGSGGVMGFIGGLLSTYVGSLASIGMSTSVFGAGMVVGARIAVPGMVVGCIGAELAPYLAGDGVPVPGLLVPLLGDDVGAHWIAPGEPFRKIGFIVALGMILGAAIVDITLVAYKTLQRLREVGAEKAPVVPGDEWKQTNTYGLLAWIGVWGTIVAVVATQVLGLPLLYVGVALALVFLFLIINGISTGVSDSNPISSAFVLTVFVLAFIGLTDPAVGLMCAAILLIATSIGVDMQQDRSTGWRLGTNRVIQFRFQVVGVVMGAFMSVAFASVFMSAYPYLETNQYAATAEHAAAEAAAAAATTEAEAERSDLMAEAWKSAETSRLHATSAEAALRRAEAALAAEPPDLAAARQELADARTSAAHSGTLAGGAAAAAGVLAAPADPALAPPPPDPAAEAELEKQKSKWQSAMTYKFVGALESLTPPQLDPARADTEEGRAEIAMHAQKKANTMTALWLGVSLGFVTELLRKVIKSLGAWQRFVQSGKAGFATDFCLDCFFLPSPYASSFGGFVDFIVTVWFAAGGVLTSFAQTIEEEVVRPYKAAAAAQAVQGEEVPEDMSTTALVGGGLIAGDSLAALTIGIVGLVGALLAA